MIVDGKGVAMGRLASFVAKEALKGNEIDVVNSEEVIITGNKKSIKEEFLVKRSRVGHSQKGPKHPARTEKIVKRAIRGMLPNFREGRGREAFKRIKCYNGIPKEFEGKEMIEMNKPKKVKFSKVKEFAR